MAISGPAIESLFEYEAMLRGYIVSAPRTDHSHYDRIVDTKKKLYRVQIKARRGNGKKSLIVRLAKSNNKGYTKQEIDVIALYVEDNNSWYIFPAEGINTIIRINIHRDKKDRFKNNWTIFR